MIDSHVHLNREEFAGDVSNILERASQSGVRGFLNVGYDIASSEESITLAENNSSILATVGIHPHDAELLADSEGRLTNEGQTRLEHLEKLAAHPRVVGIGEIGLDFYRDLSPRSAQKTAMAAQLALAERVGLPVVFHVRDAWVESLALIDQIGVPSAGGILHSFTGDVTSVAWAAERGLFLGIGGPVTYKNGNLAQLLPAAGIEMLLLETDAPWLPPVPYRGKRNEPGYLGFTRDKVAQILGLTSEDVTQQTSAAFLKLFCAGMDFRES